MKTEWQVRYRDSKPFVDSYWTSDVKHLQGCLNCNGNTLWRRESETPEEAAVRRMAALDKWGRGAITRIDGTRESFTQFADRLSPPPLTTETQVDWQTLEPIKEVPVWNWRGFWVAGVDESTWALTYDGRINLGWLCIGKAAVGSTRENALRNLAELQTKQT